jgi:tRNA uridine 5-carboxymethylaminomethyl modification enzyme
LNLDHEEDVEIIDETQTQVKYSGYIKRQLQQIVQFRKFENKSIPLSFKYEHISGFSREVREKLMKVRPDSIGQASRISGITPAAISLLLVALEKDKREAQSHSTPLPL